MLQDSILFPIVERDNQIERLNALYWPFRNFMVCSLLILS